MKKSRFTEDQIVFALKKAELGTNIEEVCRKMGIMRIPVNVTDGSVLRLLIPCRRAFPAGFPFPAFGCT